MEGLLAMGLFMRDVCGLSEITLTCDHTPLMHGNISSHFTNDMLIRIYIWVTFFFFLTNTMYFSRHGLVPPGGTLPHVV